MPTILGNQQPTTGINQKGSSMPSLKDFGLMFPDTQLSHELQFYVNTKKFVIHHPSPTLTLLEFLRAEGYTGTKLGCGEGGCGACTVVIANLNESKEIIRLTANACLMPLCTVHGKQVITVEGIGNPSNPHPVQERLALGHGSQCGFCTPGIVMSMYGLLQTNSCPGVADIEDTFDGNLCRCTGYRPILESFKTFSTPSNTIELEDEETVDDHSSIFYSSNDPKLPISGQKTKRKVIKSCDIDELTKIAPYNPEKDVKFPDHLMKLELGTDDLTCFEKDNAIWFRPTTIEQLINIKTTYPKVKLVGGNSEIGVEVKLKAMEYSFFADTSNIEELKSIKWQDESFTVGVNMTLTSFMSTLNENLKSVKDYQRSTLKAFLSNLRWFAGKQIRNFATLGGNIVTGSPISDLNPIFLATGAKLTVLSASGSREILMSSFFKGYRKIDLKEDEIVLTVEVPLPTPNQVVKAYKQAKRKDDDIAITNACFNLTVMDDKVVDLKLAYGGMAPTSILLNKTSEAGKGLVWSDSNSLDNLILKVLDELNLPYDVPGAMPSYRRVLAASMLTRFWHQTNRDLNKLDAATTHDIDEIEKGHFSSIQTFGPAFDHNPKQDPLVAKTYPHLSAIAQTTGVAQYLDDIPKQKNELYAATVLSREPHAQILSVNSEKALELEGVHAFINHADVPANNRYGVLAKDEEFFATNEVYTVGQVIGLIVADSKELAKKAARLVEVKYKKLDYVLTIEQAIQKNSFFPLERNLERGTFDSNTFQPRNENGEEIVVFEGTCRVGGQEHFYLETQGALVIPKNENGEFEVYSSTQNLNEAQVEVAKALGVPANRIVCKAKRLGGGFGGKETRPTHIAVALAVAANSTGKPVRFVLDRDEDMLISGNRHPFLATYKVAVTKDGKFKAVDFELISNAGWSYDLSLAVMDRAVTHCDNVYYFPSFKVRGRLAKTNLASNTAFRGFGGPQGMMITEMMITDIAEKLRLDPIEVRAKNFYQQGQLTHFNMEVKDWYLPEMWQSIVNNSYNRRRTEVDAFNSTSKFKRRGVAVTPTKFGISFGVKHLNQAGALVHIYTDGSVLLSHGGVEMGQGLHTKMVQLCANELKVPLHKVFISETATDKVVNASATAASASSDMYGAAILDACKQLNDRLQPFRDQFPDADIATLALKAYLNMVNLTANGFYKADGTQFDWQKNQGDLYFYFTTGVALAEVELDLLTGDHVVLAADILMDIGNSINFAIDLGQIEGAFVQGMGWCTMEETLASSTTGGCITLGPGNYKIPGFRDIPQHFKVEILSGKKYVGRKAIKGSKAIGEPPLFLGASVFFALRDAIHSIKKEFVKLESPATAELLRMAVKDKLTELATVESNGKPLWAVRP